MKKINITIIKFIIIFLAIGALAGGEIFFLYKQNVGLKKQGNEIRNLKNKIVEIGENLEKLSIKSDMLNNDLENTNISFGKRVSELEGTVNELEKREPIIKKSQDELLTEAVAKVAPAVVSIVVSKDVPKLEIVYENPFGDDPFFKDFGFRIPRYRQKGIELQKVGAGTGFLITSSGYIITNKHVVDDATAHYTVLLSDGSQKEAVVIHREEATDLAVLRIEGKNFSYIVLGDSEDIKLGQTVFAVGNALGEYNNSVSIGIISGLNRNIATSGSSGVENLIGVIQTDAAINPGNSGGPLVNLNGEVIGVNVATVRGSDNISFSIPVNDVKNIIKKIITDFRILG